MKNHKTLWVLFCVVCAGTNASQAFAEPQSKSEGKQNYDCGLTMGLDAAINAVQLGLVNYNHKSSNTERIAGVYEGVASGMESASAWLTEVKPESNLVKAALAGVSATLDMATRTGASTGNKNYWLNEIERLKQVGDAAAKQMVLIVRETCNDPKYRAEVYSPEQ